MARPPKYKGGVIVLTISWPRLESQELRKKAKHLCHLDHIGFSRVLMLALQEYIERHYPGNPQIALPEIIQMIEEPFQYQAEREYHEHIFAKNLKLAKGRGDGRNVFLKNAWKSLMRLQRLGAILGEKELIHKYSEWFEEIKKEQTNK